MTYDHNAIYKAYAGTVVRIDDKTGAYDKDGNSVTLEQSKIDTARAELDAEIAKTQYQTDRTKAFASIGDQLDMQYWDLVNGTTTWKDHIAKVKADNPKPQWSYPP